MRMTAQCALMAVLCVMMQGQRLCATTVIPPDFETLVKNAEIIFRGRVTAVRAEWTGQGRDRHIVSHVTFDVLKALKGSPASPYVLDVMGGTVGDQTLVVVGAPRFKVGDQSLLFVEHNGTQFVPLVGIMHGHYHIRKDPASGDEIVIKHDGSPLTGTAEIDEMHKKGAANPGAEAPAARPGGKAMKRADFESEIARKLAPGKP